MSYLLAAMLLLMLVLRESSHTLETRRQKKRIRLLIQMIADLRKSKGRLK